MLSSDLSDETWQDPTPPDPSAREASSRGRLGRSFRIVDDYLTVRDLVGRRRLRFEARLRCWLQATEGRPHLATYCLASGP
jgi:hypothetical protein